LLRYAHFGLSLLLVAGLVYGLNLNWGDGKAGMVWFGLGVLIYYIIGIGLAMALKDNRAFCKYLCPLAVPLKTSASLSLLKIAGTSEHCANCEACVESCPMNIRVRDYMMAGERVLSTECTLCLTCIHVCPHQSLKLTMAFDRGGKEYFDYDPSPGNRSYRDSLEEIKETREVTRL
jgi:ferredoxin-type protein NapH